MTEQAIRPSVTTQAISPRSQSATCTGRASCCARRAYGRADRGSPDGGSSRIGPASPSIEDHKEGS
jgi:hypothetical protein